MYSLSVRMLPVTWVRRWFSQGTCVSSTTYNWLFTTFSSQQYGIKSDDQKNSKYAIVHGVSRAISIYSLVTSTDTWQTVLSADIAAAAHLQLSSTVINHTPASPCNQLSCSATLTIRIHNIYISDHNALVHTLAIECLEMSSTLPIYADATFVQSTRMQRFLKKK